MKKVLWVLTLCVSMKQVSYGQTFKEWFKQKKTQIEYLANQIAALKVYGDYLEKGYTIVKDGSRFIGDIKQGDFDLHNGYFVSLKSVNPVIKNYTRVATIVSDQATILKQFKGLISYCDETGEFSASERQYISAVYSNLKTSCLKDIDDLTMVLTSGELEMKDDERFEYIDRIYADTKDKLTFTSSFCSQASGLALQRAKAAHETDMLRKLYGER